MNRAALLALSVTWLSACGGGESASQADVAAGAEPPTLQAAGEGAITKGRETYEKFCASCHDAGMDGAPVTGNPEDWEDRSRLWQAVLMEHAKAGYLEMPAKGGAGELTDLSVSDAVEFMMLTTFPDKLPDQ